MTDIKQLIQYGEDYLDYEKVNAELLKQTWDIYSNLLQQTRKYSTFDDTLTDIIKKKSKDDVKESDSTIEELDEFESKANRLLKMDLSPKELELFQKQLNNKGNHAQNSINNLERLINSYKELVLRLEPLWSDIKKDKKYISGIIWRSFFIMLGLKLFPLTLIFLVLIISYISDKISSFVFSFNLLQGLGVFVVLTIAFNFVSNKITDILYKTRLKQYMISSSIQINQIRDATSSVLQKIDVNYNEFYYELTKSEI